VSENDEKKDDESTKAEEESTRRGTVDELAKRVAALGEEDELEKQARLEEEEGRA
jgi:hypothetical protein